MATRLPLRLSTRRPLALRINPIQARRFAEKQPAAAPGSPAAIQEAKGQKSTGQLPHVSEEAAALSKTTGEPGPDIEQHGTKVQELVKGDKETQEQLPQVMKDQLKKSDPGQQSRGFSTFARIAPKSGPSGIRSFSTVAMSHRRQQAESINEQLRDKENENEEFDDEYDPDEDEMEGDLALARSGTKFGDISLPLPAGNHLRRRYDTIVDQVTKLLMRDGKLSVAQRHMATILTHLRTSPPPHASSKYPLVPGAPPLSTLPLNPVLYLTLAIDSVAPIMRIRSQKGAAGGGVALQLPVPLRQRQRRRTAVMWMLDAVDKKKGGTSGFAKKFAEEVVSVVEGKSSCWTKREALHAMGIRARANLALMARGSRGGGGRRF